MLQKLIDVSHFQQNIQWDKVASDGVDGCYLKCTQGTGFIDPCCDNHAVNARAAGLAIGYYHFASPDDNAITEAEFFHTQLNKLPAYDLIPVLDIEVNKSNLTGSQIEQWITDFIERMRELGRKTMIYSYIDFLDQYLPSTHNLGIYPLWLANYRNVKAPMPPVGWANVSLWQYTNQGTVNGISGLVDMDKPITQNFVIQPSV